MNGIEPSSRKGMGAVPYTGGTAFRVWAPNAEEVYVTGEFNGWSKTADQLADEGRGYWSKDVSGAAPGQQYRYLIVSGGKELFRVDPYSRNVTSSAGNSIICDPAFDWGAESFEAPPVNELAIYELHVGTFNDRPGGPPGDLASAIERLPYLKGLGVNAVEVMPVMEFAGGFSWGYNPSYIFAVESEYGDPKSFRQFVREAHAQGIAVIFDVVYNHFGPTDLGLWRFDGWSKNNKGGIYFYNDRRSKTPWGETRPDYGRKAVRRYIRDNVIMWLEEYHVDGLRWDMTAFIRNIHGNDNDPGNDIPDGWKLMRDINAEIKERHPGKICIAEDLKKNPFLTKCTGEGGAGFDAQWDAGFVHPVRGAVITPDDGGRDMETVRVALTHSYNGDPFQRIVYTESHDEVANGKARVPEEIAPGDAGTWAAKKRSTMGAALIFTAPGIPMIFQGQEFLEDDWFHDKDPIDWSRKDRYGGILKMYRDLTALRIDRLGFTRGLCGPNIDVHHVNNKDKAVAFHRWDSGGPGDSVIVLVNMAGRGYDNYRIGFPREGTWKVRFNSDGKEYDPEFGGTGGGDVTAVPEARDGMPCGGDVSIGPYSAVILSQ